MLLCDVTQGDSILNGVLSNTSKGKALDAPGACRKSRRKLQTQKRERDTSYLAEEIDKTPYGYYSDLSGSGLSQQAFKVASTTSVRSKKRIKIIADDEYYD